MANTVHDEFILHISSEKFIIEPTQVQNECLVIDRVSQEIKLQDHLGQIPDSAVSKPIYGIVGIIRLLAGPYLIVITKRCKVGEINGHIIWRIEDTDVLSYSRALLHLTDQQVQYNKQYVSMVQTVLQTPYFYYSTSYDLSHTLQRLNNTSPDFLELPVCDRADTRFIWNQHLLKELKAQSELVRYCLPVVHGCVIYKQCNINQKVFTWILISRRSCYRAGTRYFMRGVDPLGEVANFVETEQIIECDGSRSSFVQTRGSIPLFWNQYPNIKYKPKPKLNENQAQLSGFQRHFDSQLVTYGPQILVNLIDHKGSEDVLEKAFDQHSKLTNNPDIVYVSFDFHHECGKMRWDRLSILMDRVADYLDKMEFFLMLRDGSVAMLQEGVFRTNCIDCLDRTNVVQSMLARKSLQKQLAYLGVLKEGQNIENQLNFEEIYKNAWADNADICSIQYAGTGALKTDFTRTGKRTKLGLVRDGVNSMIRYYKNNFADGTRQDAINLFLGNYEIQESEGSQLPCPLAEKQDFRSLAVPIIILIAISMCFLSLIMATDTIFYAFFWAVMVGTVLAYVYVHGKEFVNFPKLKME